jgi:hypothetical protein
MACCTQPWKTPSGPGTAAFAISPVSPSEPTAKIVAAMTLRFISVPSPVTRLRVVDAHHRYSSSRRLVKRVIDDAAASRLV